MPKFSYEFDWDPTKARINIHKHGVAFERAATVFQDPLAVTVPDDEHSENETRWITMGREAAGQYVLVVHTFMPTGSNGGRIRMISARRPTASEVRDYEEAS